ncbi:MAG: hypothetical protein ACREJC_06440 [Tepidisphaeraceae bacterium]
MKLTRERKIYAGLMCLGLTGFLIDRAFFGAAPESAVASENVAEVRAAQTPPVGREQNNPPAPDSGSLAQRLEATARAQACDTSDIHDAFQPPASWGGVVRNSQPAPQPGEVFAQKHRLTAVALNGTVGSAVVDGRCLQVGATVDGFKLTSVKRGSVVFRSGDTEVSLRLHNEAASR